MSVTSTKVLHFDYLNIVKSTLQAHAAPQRDLTYLQTRS